MPLDPTKLISPEYASTIGARASAIDPNIAEYYNKSDNTAFADPTALSKYVQTNYQGSNVNPNNVFDYLKTTPTAASKINQVATSLFTPAPNPTDIYNKEYQAAGAGDIKTRLDALDTTINGIRQKYTDKAGNINENPWLSEASRVGRSRILTDQMNADIGNYTNQKSQLSDLYNMALNEVKLRLGLQTDYANNTKTLQGQQLDYLQNQDKTAQAANANAIDFATKNNITTPFYTVGGTIYRTSDGKAYSSPADFFADGGSQDFSNAPEVQNGGKLLSVAEAKSLGVPYGTTQAEAATMTITPGTKSSGTGSSAATKKQQGTNDENSVYNFLSGSAGSDGYVSPDDWRNALQAWISDGYPVTDFYSKFKQFINAADPQDYR
jgi:hypothetical protein